MLYHGWNGEPDSLYYNSTYPVLDNYEKYEKYENFFYNQKVKNEFHKIFSVNEKENKENKTQFILNGSKDYLIAIKDAIDLALNGDGKGIGKFQDKNGHKKVEVNCE